MLLFLIDVFGKSEVYLSLLFLFLAIGLNGKGGVSIYHSIATTLILIFGYIIITLLNERSGRKGDRKVNNQKTRKYCHKTKDFVDCKWKDLKMGDMVCVL
jgi:hypothetical protein